MTVTAATLLAPSSALASGFMNPRLADPHGHPAMPNPYAIYFNPAAIGGMRGTHLLADGTLAWRTVDFTRNATALSPQNPSTLGDPAYVAANTGDAHASNLAVIPFVAATTDFNQRNFFAGIGAYVPFGGVTQFDSRSGFPNDSVARGGSDGPQRWTIISGSQLGLFTTAAAGFRLPDERLSFALSGSLVFSNIVHYQARNLAGSDDITTEGRALIDVAGVQGSMSAGAYWEPLPDGQLRIGASYLVRPSFGETRLTGTLRQHYQTQDFDKDVDVLLTYPDVIRLGLTTMPWGRSVELRLDADYVLWSAFKRQCVVARGKNCDLRPDGSEQTPGDVLIALRREWKNTVGVRAGAGYFVDEKTEIYGALGFDTSAVSKSTLESTYPDAFKLIGSIGARREVADGIVIGASYTFVPYLSVETGRQNSFGLAGVSRTPNQDGTYDSKLMFFNLNAAFAL